MKILVCDKTEMDAIERMRKAGLTVDTNFEITRIFCRTMTAASSAPGPRSGSR
jgi:hypothetical protein